MDETNTTNNSDVSVVIMFEIITKNEELKEEIRNSIEIIFGLFLTVDRFEFFFSNFFG